MRNALPTARISDTAKKLSIAEQSQPESTQELILFLGIATLIVSVLLWNVSGAIVDDAFIYLRVSDNILRGEGWTYNLDSISNPCSGPLYSLMLLLPLSLGLSGPTSLLMLYAFGLVAFSTIVFKAVRPTGLGNAVAMSIVVLGSTTLFKSLGLETPWFLAATCIALYAFCQGRYIAAGIACGLASLLRLDAILLVPLILAANLYYRRRLSWKFLLTAALTVSPWYIFSFLQFGTVLSHSVSLKSVQATIGFWSTLPPYWVAIIGLFALPFVTLPLAALGLIRIAKQASSRPTFTSLLVLFCLGQTAAYAIAGAPLGYFWYLAPTVVGFGVCVLHGLYWLSDRFLSKTSSMTFGKVASVAGSSCAAVLAVIVGPDPLSIVTSKENRCSPLAAMPLRAVDTTYRCGPEYREAALWIRDNTDPDQTVAASEIGYIGYYADRNLVDMHGLLHPEAIEQLKHEGVDWWLQKQPDYIIVHTPGWPGEPYPDPNFFPAEGMQQFQAEFELVKSFERMAVYKRRSPAGAENL